MRYLVFSCALLLSACTFAQQKTPDYEIAASPSWIPRPMIFLGPSVVGNGYQLFAANLGGGFLLKSSQLVGEFNAFYMNAKKTNDGTFDNHSGHERFLQGRVFFPWHKGWYFGGGAQWSETATTNYTKKGWRPTFGAGQDYFTDGFNTRWQVLYITKGTDRGNALQGPEIEFWLPSPASKTHFFYRQTLGIYEFHTTVSDFRDRALTARQTSDRHVASFADFCIGWKF
jgi:hypothetical protein